MEIHSFTTMVTEGSYGEEEMTKNNGDAHDAALTAVCFESDRVEGPDKNRALRLVSNHRH